MSANYMVVHDQPTSATILQDEKEKGRLRKVENGVFMLKESGCHKSWVLTHRVDGEIRPFSLACYANKESEKITEVPKFSDLTLKIKDHIFFHNENSYSIGGAMPEKASPKDIIGGAKYICRLVNFPHAQFEEIDEETKHKMTRHRGVAVGEFFGLGADGYEVKLYGEELDDVGMLLAASTYLLYTTR
ncbi:MAG: hypothetical protein JRN20_11525 [Nitrososphaerota archaeon]|nr:hypothetical protein [Nitrososphaerota archaeon]